MSGAGWGLGFDRGAVLLQSLFDQKLSNQYGLHHVCDEQSTGGSDSYANSEVEIGISSSSPDPHAPHDGKKASADDAGDGD